VVGEGRVVEDRGQHAAIFAARAGLFHADRRPPTC
jgi:hypothetical protein